MNNLDKKVAAYKVVTTSVLAFFAVSIVQIVVTFIHLQGGQGPLGKVMTWYAAIQLVPFVVFGVLWAVARGERWVRLYRASAMTLVVVGVAGVINQLFIWFIWPFLVDVISGPYESLIMTGESIGSVLLIAVAMAFWLRRSFSHAKHLDTVLPRLTVVSVWMLIATYVAEMAYYVIRQFPDNPNLSGYMAEFIGFGWILLIFSLFFVLEKVKYRSAASFFTAAFVTLFGASVFYVGWYLLNFLTSALRPQWLVASVVTLSIVLGLGLLVKLHKTVRILVEN